LLKYYSAGGKDDSGDCIDVSCPASDYGHACLLFFFSRSSLFAMALKQAADGLF
jgi:hypothetical protein